MNRLCQWLILWQNCGALMMLTVIVLGFAIWALLVTKAWLAEKWEKYVIQKPDSRSGCCYPDDCECIVCGASNDRLDDDTLADYREDPRIKSFY